jgi:hypothetical protein
MNAMKVKTPQVICCLIQHCVTATRLILERPEYQFLKTNPINTGALYMFNFSIFRGSASRLGRGKKAAIIPAI